MHRGDIYHVDLNPIKGREQAGPRFVLIISPGEFNKLGTPLCAPITGGGDFARAAGFAVSLTGTGLKTDGVVLCHQIRTMDLNARKGKFVERAPDFIVSEVMAKVMTLLEDESS
jgi:mRNA interferase ChpB